MSQYPSQISGGPVGSLQGGMPPGLVSPTGPIGPAGLSGAAMAQQAKAPEPEPEGLEKGYALLKKMEPGIEMLPIEFSAASIAVSLRQISLDLRALVNQMREGDIGQGQNLTKIIDALNAGNGQLTNMRGAIDAVAKAKREAISEHLSRMPY